MDVSNAKGGVDEAIKAMVLWARGQLGKTDEKDICNSVHALQKLLLRDDYRIPFSAEDGLGRSVFICYYYYLYGM